MQTVQGKLSKCDEMLNDILESSASEENVTVNSDELSRLRCRHAKLSDEINKQCKRISQALQLRVSYWTRRHSLETCLEECRHKMTCLGIDDGYDYDDRLVQLEASYCCFFIISH